MTVIAAGLVTVDIVQRSHTGWLPLDEPVALSSGGTVCNIMCHLAHAGWATQVLGMVGSDSFGDLLLHDLSHFGVGGSGILRNTAEHTRRILHKIAIDGRDAGKHQFALECNHCRRVFKPVTPPAVSDLEPLVNAQFREDTVLVIDRANELTAFLVERARAVGGVVIFEPGYLSQRSDPYVQRILSGVDILKYSHELLWNGKPFGQTLRTLQLAPTQITIETRGVNGVRLSRGNRRKILVTQPVGDVRDSSGAGDAFMAGLLLGLGQNRLRALKDLREVDIEEAVTRGQARGGLSCLYLGSKGLLYRHSHAAIEQAVDAFTTSLRPPDDLGSDALQGSDYAIRHLPGACSVCGLA